MKKALLLIVLVCGMSILLLSCGDNKHVHSFNGWETLEHPTCTTNGSKVRCCDCGEKETENIPANGHIYSDDLDAICDKCGFVRKTDCTHIDTVTLPEKSATCTSTGLTEGKICSCCGIVIIQQAIIPKLDHQYKDEYNYDKESHWYKCKNCNHIKDKTKHKVDGNGKCIICEMLIDPPTEGIIYEKSDDGLYAMVVAYNGTATDIRIADTFQGSPVTTIYRKAFYDNDKITSVIIPDSVTSIGSSAFDSCDKLASIIIGNNVTDIGGYAFYFCTNLDSIIIPDSVTNIGDNAFQGCSSLYKVTLGKGLTNIGYYVFSRCTSLRRIEISENITEIKKWAFQYCTRLETVVMGNSITDIDTQAFEYCDSIRFNEYGNCKYLGNYNNPYFILMDVTTENLSSYNIHNDTKIIREQAFYNCKRLKSITIPDEVTTIGMQAFLYCTSLTSVVIGNSVTSIGTSAFQYCSALTSIVIPENVTSLGNAAFAECTELTTAVIGNHVTFVDTSTFYNCSALTSIVISNSVTSIANFAFYGCLNLKDVYYTGNKEEWNAMTIGSNNTNLTSATIHYNYVYEE